MNPLSARTVGVQDKKNRKINGMKSNSSRVLQQQKQVGKHSARFIELY